MKQLLITIAALVLVGCGPPPPDISIIDAARDGNIEAVKQHIAAGTDVSARHNMGRHTPLYFAVFKGHMEIAELLIANGADVNAKNIGDFAALHMAASWGHKEIVELLITNGADVNAKDENGETPLDKAIISKHTETADLLRKHGAKTAEELDAAGN